MDRERLRDLLSDFKSGKKSLDEIMEALRNFPYDDIGFARLDSHRSLRTGYPEVVFCEGKSPRQVVEIMKRSAGEKQSVLATRSNAEIYELVKKNLPSARFYETARIIHIPGKKQKEFSGTILVVTGGTSDIPVAEEAAVTAELFGNKVKRLFDVGVAGVHRILNNREVLFKANVLIVVAGMEGALASVVGGLVDKPVIAVPTSIGYGASFKGIAPLLTMLNSCAPGVAVVNIDNGFGAGYLASIINRMGEKRK